MVHRSSDSVRFNILFFETRFRDRPVPLPSPGIQMTSLSHVEDIASMLATVPGNASALKQEFNICSDRCVSFEGRFAASFLKT